MKTKWIIEDFAPSNGWGLLAKEVIAQGHECVIADTNDPNYEYYDDECWLREDDVPQRPILIQASFQFSDNIVQHFSYKPARFLTIENYDCTKYYQYFTDNLFNNDYVYMTVGDIERKIDFLENILGERESGRIFIRPNTGLKSFTGMVFINRIPYFNNDWSFVKRETKSSDLVVISSPKTIKSEYRFVVANGEVITGSQYKLNYDTDFRTLVKDKDSELFMFAQQMAELYQPDPVYTLDIVVDEDNQMKVLEVNSFSCAGLYACDMKIIVERVSKIATDNFKIELD